MTDRTAGAARPATEPSASPPHPPAPGDDTAAATGPAPRPGEPAPTGRPGAPGGAPATPPPVEPSTAPAIDPAIGRAPEPPATSRVARVAWVSVGCIAVGLGTLGMFLPVLPTTGFFVLAAGAFSRGSPRLERWVLGLPTIGPLVRDYRLGLGMPRRAKVLAISTMWLAITASSVLALRDRPAFIALAVALGLIGTAWILWRIPTREAVLARRAAEAAAATTG
mgnify:CR=1 FL=1